MSKIGRNQPCPCGSGQKYKRCHGRFRVEEPAREAVPPPEVAELLKRHEAERRIREAQQGLGRPIVATRFNDHQVVAVGNNLLWSKTWKTFTDFLGSYIKKVLDPAWGNAEIAKPLAERHPIMQWYDGYCRYQKATIPVPGVVTSADVTGVVACYLGLAYSLYLIAHNVELQQRLVQRLKDPANFQGAYYELIVANCLIRAGFELTLEDESDRLSKHCEFAAVSEVTGKKYWVEAKMRSVAGLLGKGAKDGSPDQKSLSRLVKHLTAALAKPAADERLIFIDLNAPQVFDDDGKPTWVEPAMQRLERYERNEMKPGVTAYVFVTNMAFHRDLNGPAYVAAAPIGLGMPEFARPGPVRLPDAYRAKQKHEDAYAIGESIVAYLKFPSTFDGSLPSEAFGRSSSRTLIGETYFFEDVDGGLVGTVTAATVDEQEKVAVIAVSSPDGKGHLLKQQMSDAEFDDYRAHPDAYFGRVVRPTKEAKNLFELFEFFMDTYKHSSREKLVEWLAGQIDPATLDRMSTEDLALAYCDRLCAWADQRNQRRAEKPSAAA